MNKPIDYNGITINTKMIKDYISENCYSKAAFARKCKISIWVLNKILNGNTNFRFTAIMNIAEVMQVPTYELVIAD